MKTRLRGIDRRGAFTLLELLTVIAIIAILASLLLPGLAAAKKRALSAKCKSNMRHINLAIAMYVTDSGFYPPLQQLPPVGIQPDISNIKVWYEFLEPHLNAKWTNDAFQCPSGGLRFGPVTNSFGGLYFPPNYRNGSISYNALGVGVRASPYGYAGLGSARGAPEGAVTVPSDMIAIGDAFAALDRFIFSENFVFGRNWEPNPGNVDVSKKARARHFETLNVGFCDGHVAALKVERLFGPTAEDRSRWNIDHDPHP
jgi:prepilin-type N-terminal cleavage/methylation domain-containing protein/prepilin-type processing-associated H-X9-DG protein